METTRLWALIDNWLNTQMFPPSQNQLAQKIGVARNAVSKWKYGQARPTPQNLHKLADITNIPFITLRTALVEDLGYTTEPPQQDPQPGTSPEKPPAQ